MMYQLLFIIILVKVALASPTAGQVVGANIVHASYSTFVMSPDREYRIRYKSTTDRYLGTGKCEISMASSDKIKGPYASYGGNSVISYADRGVDLDL